MGWNLIARPRKFKAQLFLNLLLITLTLAASSWMMVRR